MTQNIMNKYLTGGKSLVLKKEEKKDRAEQAPEQDHLTCRVCGRIVQPEAGSRMENDGGGIYCLYCKAERESCGCSD